MKNPTSAAMMTKLRFIEVPPSDCFRLKTDASAMGIIERKRPFEATAHLDYMLRELQRKGWRFAPFLLVGAKAPTP